MPPRRRWRARAPAANDRRRPAPCTSAWARVDGPAVIREKLPVLSARTSTWALAIVALGTLAALTPSALADADTLSHLAVGRWIAAHGVPHTDPFTFPAPDAAWSNPEWLGDLVWYGLWRLGGPAALQVFKLTLLAATGWLILRAGAAFHAPSRPLLLLLLGVLPAAASTLTTRNHLHAYWLLPAFTLVVAGQARRPWLWLVLLPLGWLWGNVHGSFVLGWAVLAALVLGRSLAGEPVWWRFALPVLAAQPLLPLLGPAGASLYRQVWDHARGLAVYRALLIEWKSPLESGAWLGVLPLHALAAALVLVAPRLGRQRRWWGPLAVALLGMMMAYTSRRFLALPAVLAGAVVVCGLRESFAAWTARARGLAFLALAVVVIAYGSATVAVTRARARPDALARPHGPQGAAEFLSRFAPEGARLFNSYNDGPWLVWTTAPRIRHYLDPRNNLGSSFVVAYAGLVRAPERFDAQAASLGFTLALLDLDDALYAPLVAHLDLAADWQPVYLDGHRAVYARRTSVNQGLLDRFGYAVLRPSLSARDLTAPTGEVARLLDEDLVRLAPTAPRLRDSVQACAPILAAVRIDAVPPAAAAHAAAGLQSLLDDDTHLSGVLTGCFARTVQRLQGGNQARQLLLEVGDELVRDQTFRSVAAALDAPGDGAVPASPPGSAR